MDNVLTFWEATVIAVKNKQNLAVLLLDFEKVYDRALTGIVWKVLCIAWASTQHGLRVFLVFIGMHVVRCCWQEE